MSTALEQFPTNPQISAILDEIIEAGGEITAEQEIELGQLMASTEGAIDTVKLITALDNFVFMSSKWIEMRRIESKRREVLAGMLREDLRRVFKKEGGKLASPIKDEEGHSVSYVSASTKPGTVDPNNPELEHTTTVRGYTPEQVDASGIPSTFFTVERVYKLDLEMVGQYLDRGEEIGTCRRKEPQSYVRISSPYSLRSAEEKKKREERKAARQYPANKGG